MANSHGCGCGTGECGPHSNETDARKAGSATAAIAVIDSSWSLVVGLPVTHFFLFCNLFRLSRPLE